MSQELLAGQDWVKASGTATFTKSADGLKLEGGLGWIYTDFISLPNSSGTTYEYDFDISVTANDQVYIQIERFNSAKGSISNNAATNCVSGYKPAADVSHVRYKGTIALATFDSPAQNTAFIKVRICNGYNSTTGTHIIHNWSLKAVSGTRQNPSINKLGQMVTDHYREHTNVASFGKDGVIYGQEFYEY